MGIPTKEFQKEELILSKVSKLLNNTLTELRKDVYDNEENFTEFKKMMWENSSSFDAGEIKQVMASSSQEAEKMMMKQRYFKRLCQIKDKLISHQLSLKMTMKRFGLFIFLLPI